MIELRPEPLTRESFAPFGDVIETEGARHFPINAGTIERYHDLAAVELGEQGRPLISIASCNRTTELPYRVPLVERHSLGSQAFIPLNDTPMIVVVAPPGESVDPTQLRAFVSNGRQGINYHPGVWHMPLITADPEQRFIVVDRGGPGHNCDELPLEEEVLLTH